MTGTSHDDDHSHDGGLAADMRRVMQRRAALGLLTAAGAGAGAWWLLGGPGQAEATVQAVGTNGGVCVKLPEETAGPFPADGTNVRAGQTVNVLAETGVERRDIRPSFAGLSPVAEGVPLEVEISLVDVDAGCAPLAGLAVYLWHCDAMGQYSLYSLPESNALRGLQRADAAGVVRFTTIFPGAYDGRWPHMHFEVFADGDAAANGRAAILTSQFALPGDVAAQVYAADARYGDSAANLGSTTLTRDMVFRDNTPEQLAAQTMVLTGDAATGFVGRVTVGLRRA